jgi:hypothetical protein
MRVSILSGVLPLFFAVLFSAILPPQDLPAQAYDQMIHAVAQHLRADARAYDAIRIVKISGINQLTEETGMPTVVTPPPDSCQPSAVPIWQHAGYRPKEVLKAWEELATSVASAFPDKLLAIEVYENNDFPPIDEDGEVATPQSPKYLNVKQSIISSGIRMFPGRFAVQWDGLTAAKSAPSVLAAGRSGAIVGWQTNEYNGLEGSGCGSNDFLNVQGCSNVAYADILRYGIKLGGQNIEIWPSDAEGFPDAVSFARKQLN